MEEWIFALLKSIPTWMEVVSGTIWVGLIFFLFPSKTLREDSISSCALFYGMLFGMLAIPIRATFGLMVFSITVVLFIVVDHFIAIPLFKRWFPE